MSASSEPKLWITSDPDVNILFATKMFFAPMLEVYSSLYVPICLLLHFPHQGSLASGPRPRLSGGPEYTRFVRTGVKGALSC